MKVKRSFLIFILIIIAIIIGCSKGDDLVITGKVMGARIVKVNEEEEFTLTGSSKNYTFYFLSWQDEELSKMIINKSTWPGWTCVFFEGVVGDFREGEIVRLEVGNITPVKTYQDRWDLLISSYWNIPRRDIGDEEMPAIYDHTEFLARPIKRVFEIEELELNELENTISVEMLEGRITTLQNLPTNTIGLEDLEVVNCINVLLKATSDLSHGDHIIESGFYKLKRRCVYGPYREIYEFPFYLYVNGKEVYIENDEIKKDTAELRKAYPVLKERLFVDLLDKLTEIKNSQPSK